MIFRYFKQVAVGLFVLMIAGVNLLALPKDTLDYSHHISPHTATLGDIFSYEIVVTYNPQEIKIIDPLISENLNTFSMHDYQVITSANSENEETKTFKFAVAAFELGENILPTQTISYQYQGEIYEFQLPSLSVTIQSILTETPKDIIDIKPLIPVTLNIRTYIISAIVAVVLIVLIAGITWYIIKRKKSGGNILQPKIVEDTRPADEIAIEALADLKRKKLLENGRIKQFHSELIEIMKDYLSRIYNHSLQEMTTEEILHFFSKGIDEQTLRRIKKMLELSDMVKFAKLMPNTEDTNENFDRAHEVILRTKDKGNIT